MNSRRDQLTKKAVKEALAELLTERQLGDVTVSDICQEAGISRQTFYNHFPDKYAVPQWHFDSICARYLYETGRSLSFHDAFLLNTRSMVESREFFMSLGKAKGYQSVFSYARRSRTQTLLETLRDFKGIEVTGELEDLVRYHVEGETYLIYRWAERGMVEPPEQLTELILDAIPQRLYQLIKDPVPRYVREAAAAKLKTNG